VRHQFRRKFRLDLPHNQYLRNSAKQYQENEASHSSKSICEQAIPLPKIVTARQELDHLLHGIFSIPAVTQVGKTAGLQDKEENRPAEFVRRAIQAGTSWLVNPHRWIGGRGSILALSELEYAHATEAP